MSQYHAHEGKDHYCSECGRQHHHSDGFCPHCSKHFDHCDCLHTCEHPIIFDRRIVVDEHVLHHGHFDCDDHHPCGKRFICDDRFRIRLGRLDGGMAFRLRQLIDCEAKLEIDCEEETGTLHGTICYVGSDFVEVSVMKKKKKKRKKKSKFFKKKRGKKKKACTDAKCKKEEFRLVPFDSIKSISVEEEDCDCC